MTQRSSTHFFSALVEGSDWRDITKQCLNVIQEHDTQASSSTDCDFNIGFLYVSADLADDCASIVSLLKKISKIETWHGGVARILCTNDKVTSDGSAVSMLVGHIDPDDFHQIRLNSRADVENLDEYQAWAQKNMPYATLLHADPKHSALAKGLAHISEKSQSFVMGGLMHHTGAVSHYGSGEASKHGTAFSALAFSGNVNLQSILSYGSQQIGDVYSVTKLDQRPGETLVELDDSPALDRMYESIESIKNAVPEGAPKQREGQVGLGLMQYGSDQQNHIGLNIIGVDENARSLRVNYALNVGDQIKFFFRDGRTVVEDIKQKVAELEQRLKNEFPDKQVVGGLFISCLSRYVSMQNDGYDLNQELQEIEAVFDVPLCGFYSSGEVFNGMLHSNSAILILFLA